MFKFKSLGKTCILFSTGALLAAPSFGQNPVPSPNFTSSAEEIKWLSASGWEVKTLSPAKPSSPRPAVTPTLPTIVGPWLVYSKKITAKIKDNPLQCEGENVYAQPMPGKSFALETSADQHLVATAACVINLESVADKLIVHTRESHSANNIDQPIDQLMKVEDLGKTNSALEPWTASFGKRENSDAWARLAVSVDLLLKEEKTSLSRRFLAFQRFALTPSNLFVLTAQKGTGPGIEMFIDSFSLVDGANRPNLKASFQLPVRWKRLAEENRPISDFKVSPDNSLVIAFDGSESALGSISVINPLTGKERETSTAMRLGTKDKYPEDLDWTTLPREKFGVRRPTNIIPLKHGLIARESSQEFQWDKFYRCLFYYPFKKDSQNVVTRLPELSAEEQVYTYVRAFEEGFLAAFERPSRIEYFGPRTKRFEDAGWTTFTAER